ncbi:MAG: hypothetical protein ACK55Z_14280, partial [bacterium]
PFLSFGQVPELRLQAVLWIVELVHPADVLLGISIDHLPWAERDITEDEIVLPVPSFLRQLWKDLRTVSPNHKIYHSRLSGCMSLGDGRPRHEPPPQVLDHRGLPLASRGRLHYPRPNHHRLAFLLHRLKRDDGDLPGLYRPAHRCGDCLRLCREKLHIHVIQPSSVQYGVLLLIANRMEISLTRALVGSGLNLATPDGAMHS